MKTFKFFKILLTFLFVFVSTQSFAKTIKWSMQGDSLTLDPHAQNEGPTTQVSRQVYEALVTRYDYRTSVGNQVEHNRSKHLDF